MSVDQKQTTHHILMVRPANFGFNEETATNNTFQSNDTSQSVEQIKQQAIVEFDQFVQLLRANGVKVRVEQDKANPLKPDAVFPNNWITTHHDGTIITYPMFASQRRLERDQDIIQGIKNDFSIRQHIHLEAAELDNIMLEGTGSLILDRPNRIAYACRSVRTHEQLLDRFCQIMNYRKVVFKALADGTPIYHTNVMMALGETFVVICMESVPDSQEKEMLQQAFAGTQKEIIEITLEQMNSFAGNMLQIRNLQEETFLVMSTQAFESLTTKQIQQIEQHTKILHSDIRTIEKYGGGSARCMMAEIFLPGG